MANLGAIVMSYMNIKPEFETCLKREKDSQLRPHPPGTSPENLKDFSPARD